MLSLAQHWIMPHSPQIAPFLMTRSGGTIFPVCLPSFSLVTIPGPCRCLVPLRARLSCVSCILFSIHQHSWGGGKERREFRYQLCSGMTAPPGQSFIHSICHNTPSIVNFYCPSMAASPQLNMFYSASETSGSQVNLLSV